MKTPSHRCDPRRTNTAKARLQVRAGHRVRDSEQKACLKSPNHQGFQSTKSVGWGKTGSFLKKKTNKQNIYLWPNVKQQWNVLLMK